MLFSAFLKSTYMPISVLLIFSLAKFINHLSCLLFFQREVGRKAGRTHVDILYFVFFSVYM